MKYQYYPGCSLKGTGKAYEESLLGVFKTLGAELQELDDWNCCGATAYMSVDEIKSFTLAGRNLALAEREQEDLVTPCSACYLVLNKAQHYLKEYPDTQQRVNRALNTAGLTYSGAVKVRHPLDVLINDIGLDAIRAQVKKPLKGLRVAPYYGCQIVRPYSTFDDQSDPVLMDQLMEAAGADVVYYPLKTRCCGGSEMGTVPEVGLRLAYILLNEARRREADVIVTVCPLCQFNLDGYQDQISRKYGSISMPVLYFTQVLGLALGLSARQVGLKRSIVSAEPALAKREVTYA